MRWVAAAVIVGVLAITANACAGSSSTPRTRVHNDGSLSPGLVRECLRPVPPCSLFGPSGSYIFDRNLEPGDR